MASKDFILQRIHIYAGKEIDPNVDDQVVAMLKERFEISLPQRRSMAESLEDAISDHEIVNLIAQYRSMK
ncbi:hypothetical protein A9Q99_10550 [Gammaproteobacteria bacterium 45_16_T64]|nr:hypothetical protein A9Q99_10550 [Gammaproteobacteria bacterium 45_16_T64]